MAVVPEAGVRQVYLLFGRLIERREEWKNRPITVYVGELKAFFLSLSLQIEAFSRELGRKEALF